MSDHYIIDLTLYTYMISILLSVTTLIIYFTLKQWRTRDGKMMLNIMMVDLLFACSSVVYLFCRSVQCRYYLAQIALYLVLLSYAYQTLIAANRYIVVNFTFTYKNVLNRSRLFVVLFLLWMFTSLYLITSLTDQQNGTNKSFILSQKVLMINNKVLLMSDKVFMMYISTNSIICFSAILFVLSVLTVTLEIKLRCTATSHRERLRTLLKSIQTNMAPITKRKFSFQNFKNSFSGEHLPVRKTSIFLFGIHIFITVCILNASLCNILKHRYPSIYLFSKYSTLVMSVLISLRPTVNTLNSLSYQKLKCFKRVFFKHLGINLKHNSEYYDHNQTDIQERIKKRSSCLISAEFSK
nr:uncharacterized protein LOC105846242 [Hydra vulgaris]XP_047125580.1 uncharacterized protein LOC105846242 [Hydra vulgaris]XP_047125581.1 uncharacterized protein LOC105846242 [Hydra vulgaris]XP_047125582.1 uncharacterized protein LOC105846242 [Hydra vulgaris]